MKTVRNLTAVLAVIIVVVILGGCVFTHKDVVETDSIYFTFTEINGGYAVALTDDEELLSTLPSDISLPSKYNGKSIVEISASGFYASDIVSVKIPKSVVTIGAAAFSSCDKLKSVEFKSGLITIGDYAFYSCKALTKFDLPDTLESIGKSAFQNCGIADIDLLLSVKIIGDNAFNGCSNLASVYVGMNVHSIGLDAFKGCNSNIKFTVSDLNATYKVFNGEIILK